MSDSTLGLTFSDHIIRVAEYLGVAYYGAAGDQAAQAPTDTHDLDMCKRIVNDGYRRFLGESPLWRFLTVPVQIQFKTRYTGTVTSVQGVTTGFTDSAQTGYGDDFFNGYNIYLTHNTTTSGNTLGVDVYTVTDYTSATGAFVVTRQTIGGGVSASLDLVVADSYEMAASNCVYGQNYRYYLPDDFAGSVMTPFTYDVGGPRIEVAEVDELRIRELRVGANSSGTPSVCAIRKINNDNTATGNRWELIVWPIPTGLNRLTAVYRRFPNKLSSLTDSSVAGFQHDDTVVAAAIAAAEIQRNDTVGAREQVYQQALARSRKLDARSASGKVADFGDRSEERASGRPLNYYGVTNYNGSDVSGY
jgi:hypothetical protein